MCVVLVHYRTPEFLTTAVESFRSFYPETPMLLVDNGSNDGSRSTVERLCATYAVHTKALMLERNIFHGPAMDRALQEIEQENVLLLDSDTETLHGGFLEEMQQALYASEKVYAVGRVQRVNKRGFKSAEGIDILLPAYMMIRRSLYLQFPPFEHHGQPTLKNFTAARNAGYEIRSYPIERFIEHTWRGTAAMFGYGLGFKGKFNFVLNKIGL
jgi:glycosyltransferase involved in cell wall biosynthesis